MTLSKFQERNEYEPGRLPLFWWDRETNFGDFLGPFLAELITGRRAFNIRHLPGVPGLASVGSISAKLPHAGIALWGSGLLRPIRSPASHLPSRVHAVRGRLTRKQMQRHYGSDVPKVFGDPALLLPKYYQPAADQRTKGRIALIPHFLHREGALAAGAADDIALIDVAGEPEDVLGQIASARCVVSTSLHGIICAQAYGVPWAWLQNAEHDVNGGAFKFEDFFSTLGGDPRQSHLAVGTEDFTLATIRTLSNRAAIYPLSINLDARLDAFPF